MSKLHTQANRVPKNSISHKTNLTINHKRGHIKAIAALGVVAGLGLAALPAFSYAAEVSGDVKVETEVTPAIAMRIHSNADETCEDTDSDPTTPDVCTDTYGFIGYNPAEAQGPSDPAATAAGAASQATGLSLSSNQADSTSLYSNIEVRSNTGKFKLEVADADTDTAMRNNSGSTTTNEYIPAGVTTTTSGNDTVIDPTVAGWALKGGDITDWTAITANNATPLTIKSVGSNTTNSLAYSDNLTVNYAVASGLTKTGVYNDTITYTATALDSATLTPEEEIAAAFAACGENEGDECTVAGVDYVRLKDGNLWTKNSQGTSAWSESLSDTEPNLAAALCPAGTSLPTKTQFDSLIQAYGGTDDGYGGYGETTGALNAATGWSGNFWSATESPSNPSRAYRLYVYSDESGSGSNDKTLAASVVCVR